MRTYNIVPLLALVLVFAMAFVSADQQTLGPFPKGQPINLIQICSNCTYNNITSVVAPNGTFLITNVAMTKVGSQYNYTLGSAYTSALGRYLVNGVGDLDGTPTVWSYDFYVTPTGIQTREGESGVLIFIVLTVFLVSMGLFIFALFMKPSVFKGFLYFLCAILLLAGVMFTVTLSQNYVQTNEAFSNAYGYFLYLLMILVGATMVIALVFVVIAVLKGLRQRARFVED